MHNSTPCPEAAQYRRLMAGQLSADCSGPLLDHLEQCDACALRIGEQPEQDTLVDLIRTVPTLADAEIPEEVCRLVEQLRQLKPAVSSSAPAADPAQTHVETEAGLLEVTDFLAPPQAEDELGRLGPYRVLEVLGVGGMSIVFRAEDTHLHRNVALKVLAPERARRGSARQRFLHEARATAAIKHDHIVSVYQVGEDRGIPYLAMELLSGETLDSYLKRIGKLPVDEALRIGREMALGLAAAHQRGLIHRDIKPANVWLEPRDHGGGGGGAPAFRVKILDFGLARAVGQDSRITSEGAIVGTPAFMSPEQAQGQDVDPRCDLFSLGCVLYRMATGQAPFREADLISTLVAISVENPRPPREVTPALPAALSELILHLLAKAPGDRPASAAVVAETLDRLASGQTLPPAPTDPGIAGSKWHTARRWLLGTGVAACLVLLGLWAGGVFRLRTADGTIVLENLPADAEILVDGQTARVTYGPDRKWIEVRAAPGERRLLVKAAGFEVKTQEITLQPGERRPLSVRLDPLAVKPTPPRNQRRPSYVLGDWHLEGGELVQKKLRSHTFLMFGDRDWSDYDITVETLTSSGQMGSEGGNLLFRVHTPGNYLCWSLGGYSGKFDEIFFFDNARWGRDVGLVRTEHRTDHWYHMRVSVRGTHFRCWLDGELLFDFQDKHFPKGQVGLSTWNSNTVVRFRNFKVTDPSGQVLYEGFPDLQPVP